MNTLTYTDVSVSEAKQMIENENILILDVRTQEEFDVSHIEGSTLIPVDDLGARIDEVPDNTRILVYCRSGRRSVIASNILLDNGHTDVHNMLGGINAWISEGYPVVIPFNPTTYDANSNALIEKSEVMTAIIDYFEDRITKEDVLALIIEYFKH